MQKKAKLFTEKHFILAWDCPTKVYYSEKSKYYNQSMKTATVQTNDENKIRFDASLQNLFPEAIVLQETDLTLNAFTVRKLLTQKKIEIINGCVQVGYFSFRFDYLKKVGNTCFIYDFCDNKWDLENDTFLNNNISKLIKKSWESQIATQAFKEKVFKLGWPYLRMIPNFLLINKKWDDELVLVSVENECRLLKNKKFRYGLGFHEQVNLWHLKYLKDKKVAPELSSKCHSCQFKNTDHSAKEGYRDGCGECIRDIQKLENKLLERPKNIDYYGFSGTRLETIISDIMELRSKAGK